MEHVPFTIVGGGIIGVLVAKKIRAFSSEGDIVLLDKEPFAGHHNTTRNSGVLHAGIYYETGSLKHLLCIDGHKQWQKLAKTYDIPLLMCGKYVIATNGAEQETLAQYYSLAQKNGVQGLRKMTAEDFREIAPYTTVVDGFFSAQTGILDISTGINQLFSSLAGQNIVALLNTEALEMTRKNVGWQIKTNEYSFSTDCLINCGGLGAVALRKKLGLQDIEDKLVKGNYLKLNKPYYNDKLVYPVPLKNLKGLGVHTSFHMDRIVRFGPNTEDIESADYKNHEQNIDIMLPAIQEKFKNIEKKDLSLDYVGVRTKILKNGQLYPDFLIQGPAEHGLPGYFETLGIESPGMTAAPAIADLVVKKLRLS
jgi:L-2-hydroxyglutarate oxidase LhgO